MSGRALKPAAFLIMCVFLMGSAHVSFADDLTFTEAYFTQPEEYSGFIVVPGKGPMRYSAQNDPLWGSLAYESSGVQKRRPFRDGAAIRRSGYASTLRSCCSSRGP